MDDAELLVIGSGAAGLSAALTGAMLGAKVTLLEATDLLGGTTSLSGALLWAPANRWQLAAGFDDSPDMAKAYVKRCLGPRADDPRWDVFFDRINPFIDEVLVRECGLDFELLRYSDSFGEWPEGRTSRHITATPFPIRRLGSWEERLRRPAIPGMGLMSPAAMETVGWINPSSPRGLVRLFPGIISNLARKRRTMGIGLVAAMTCACLRRGVRIMTGARVIRLLTDDKRVTGVATETFEIRARRGVVLAVGGFSWDEQARAANLPTYVLPQDPPTNRGDNLRLAQQVDADLRYLDEAWNIPGNPLPSPYMGERIGQTLVIDRMLPHQIWVNLAGRRFVNEASQNAAEAFRNRNQKGDLTNYPCFSIFDQQYREKYPIYMKFGPKADGPDDLVTAATLTGLAEKIGVCAKGLAETVHRYNTMIAGGRDHDFGRGDGTYERYFTGAIGSLGTIEKPPFYALPVYSGGVGTKGGAMTDANARVLGGDGRAIDGLYAAGNASAAFNGPITVAAGCTIPPALVMGHAAALHAMGKPVVQA